MLKYSLLIFFIIFCTSNVFAAKIENLPFVSDLHVGMVTGIGTGVNIGFDAGFHLNDVMIGPEIEQVITDVDYSASVNATRVGGFINVPVWEGVFANFHIGHFNFQVKNNDIYYDEHGQTYHYAVGPQTYKGNYQAVSLDFAWQEFLISPKLVSNQIEDGPRLNGIDLNIGRNF